MSKFCYESFDNSVQKSGIGHNMIMVLDLKTSNFENQQLTV